MVVLGLVLLALAVAASIVAIAQNPHATVDVDVLGTHYNMHAYWIFVAGMVVLAVAAIGLSMMRAGAAHSASVRRERRELAAENARLNERVSNERIANDRMTDGRMTDADGRAYTADEVPDRSRHAWGRRSHRTV
jgi:hypothetical protein